MAKEPKVRSVATINPTPDQKAVRNISRVKTILTAIDKAKSRGKADRVASLQIELDRRLAEVRALKEALAEIDA